MSGPSPTPGQNTIEAAFLARNSGLLREIAAERKGLTDQQRNALKLLADLIDRAVERRGPPGVKHPPLGSAWERAKNLHKTSGRANITGYRSGRHYRPAMCNGPDQNQPSRMAWVQPPHSRTKSRQAGRMGFPPGDRPGSVREESS